jgi:DnaJ-class molecular chaperone
MDNQIEVMVADASHEVYVDTILETITTAAKVRGTGNPTRTRCLRCFGERRLRNGRSKDVRNTPGHEQTV